MTALLETRGLSGGYGAAPVLRDINMSLAAGEMVACFGANGAGKTTLLRALCGALKVCTGEINFNNEELNGTSIWARAKRGIAHVPEGRHVFKPMTVKENLEAGGLATKAPVPLSEVYDLFPKLFERQSQAAGTLSGGEQQMVVIGRAMMGDPKIMLIDEMSAGLAPIMTDRLVDGLVQIRARGVAMLLVEQAPHFIADVVDRAYLLEQGRVTGEGTLAELGGAEGIANMYLGVT